MIVLQSLGLLYLMWLAYVLAMHIIAKWETLNVFAKVLGAPPAIAAYLLDVILNCTLLVVLFRDLPREWTITDRLHRYQLTPGKRARIAQWVCENLLNPFDTDHC